MNITAIIILIIFIVFAVYIVKMLEKEIPLLLKRKRKDWEAELTRKEVIKTHNEKHDLEIKKVVKSENNKKMYKDNVRKGRDYELFITDYFQKQGYQIKPFGILNGRKDKGIDVIIKKDKEITLIQCKNWKADSSYKIEHKHLKEFIGNTTAFLESNKEKANGYVIKRMYVTSNDVLDNSARHFLRDNSIVEHRVIPMEGH